MIGPNAYIYPTHDVENSWRLRKEMLGQFNDKLQVFDNIVVGCKLSIYHTPEKIHLNLI